MLALLLLIVSTGCGPGSSEPQSSIASELSFQSVDAKTRLQQVFQRYQGCSYYQDRGEVVLNARNRNQPDQPAQTHRAPMRVSLSGGRLMVDAYAVRLRVDPERTPQLLSWFEEPQTSNFDSQTLWLDGVITSDQRLRLDALLQDEVLRSRLSAGLAGPPPQLEWLLADDPMAKMFASEAEFRWVKNSTGNLQVIEVISEHKRFLFEIDPRTSLIQQVVLPNPENLSDAMQLSLTLRLNEATFQPPTQSVADGFRLRPDFSPVYVRQFLPIVPPPPSPLIGKFVQTRELPDANWVIVSRAPEDVQQGDGWVRAWQTALPGIATDRFQETAVIGIESPSLPEENLSRMLGNRMQIVAVDRAARLIRELRLPAGATVLLSGQGEVLMVADVTDGVSLPNLVAALADAITGVDVPAKMISDFETQLDAYRTALDKVRVHP